MDAESRFIRSQGFTEPAPESCGLHFAALQFQPRIIGVILIAGMILQAIANRPSVALFVVLGIVLWWGALLPDANVFEAAYNPTHRRRTRARGSCRAA